MNHDIENTIANAARGVPNFGLADYRLETLTKRLDGDEYGLHTVENPFYGRCQLGGHIVADLERIFERKRLPEAIYTRIDYADSGTAVAVLARLLDREIADPVGTISAELDEIETTEMEQAIVAA